MDRDANSEGPTDERPDAPASPEAPGGDFGINAAFVEEILDSFRVDPDSVHPDWSGVFRGGRPTNGAEAASAPAPAAPACSTSQLATQEASLTRTGRRLRVLRMELRGK